MKAIFKYNILASLPQRLKPLEKLAYNLWFSWHHDIANLFRRMDTDLWESSKQNPVYILGAIAQERLEELAEDEGFWPTWTVFIKSWKDISLFSLLSFLGQNLWIDSVLPIFRQNSVSPSVCLSIQEALGCWQEIT